MEVLLVLAALGPATRGRPDSPPGEPRPPRAVVGPNSVFVGTIASERNATLMLRYGRRLTRRLGLGLSFELDMQPPGYWHLVGLAETLLVSVWPRSVGRGFNVTLVTGVAHQVLAVDPRISSQAVVLGGTFGWQFPLPRGFAVGFAVGWRHGLPVAIDPRICTQPRRCPMIRSGPAPRLLLEVGGTF